MPASVSQESRSCGVFLSASWGRLEIQLARNREKENVMNTMSHKDARAFVRRWGISELQFEAAFLSSDNLPPFVLANAGTLQASRRYFPSALSEWAERQ